MQEERVDRKATGEEESVAPPEDGDRLGRHGEGGTSTPAGTTGGRRGRPSRRTVVTGITVAVAGAAAIGGVLTRRPALLPWGDPQRAYAARGFTDSVGVNLHLSYGDTPYADVDRVRSALRRAGIRHVRDGWDADREDVLPAFEALVADGVRLDLIVGTPAPDADDVEEGLRRQLAALADRLPIGVRTLEGVNEYDNTSDPEWVTNLRAHHEALHKLVEDGVAGEAYALVAPSFVKAESRAQVGRLPATFGNMHSYTGGDQPREEHLSSELELAAEVTGRSRVMATETGFNTAVANTDGQPGVPESVAATYVPRQFLENFRRGVVRTFTYELFDESADPDLTVSEANYGLVRHDGSDKESFTALARLMQLLADEPGTHHVEDLEHTLSHEGGDRLRRLLLHKSTGEHLLALWLEESVWDQDEGRALETTTATVRLSVGGGKQIRSLHRLTGDALDEDVSRSELTTPVGPDVVLVRIA